MSDSVGRNSLIMASGTAASRITGQLRTILLAAALGTTGLAANAYQAGSMIPQVIYTLVSGGIFNAVLVPHIVRTMKSDNAEEQLNKLVTFAISLLIGMTVIVAALAYPITKLYVAGSPDMVALAYAFTLWCTPQIFFYGLYTILGQILAVHNKFGTYAWSSVGANIISCIGFGIFIALFGNFSDSTLAQWDSTKIMLTAGAWTAGVAFQALVLFIPLLRSGFKYKPKFGVRGIGLRTIGPIAAWSMGIVGIDQIANVVTTRVLTSAPEKAAALGIAAANAVPGNASYQNAYTIYMLPYSLIAVSVATAIFPKISQAVANHAIGDAREALSTALRNVGIIMWFCVAVCFIVPDKIVGALLPTVNSEQIAYIASTLMFLCLCLPLSAAYLIIQRTFYAFEDGKSPFIFMVILYAIQLGTLGIGLTFITPQNWCNMVALSVTIGYILAFIPLVLMLRKRFEGRIDGKRILGTYARSILAAVVSALAALFLFNPLASLVHLTSNPNASVLSWIDDLISLAIVGVLMLVVYVAVLWLLRTEELINLVHGLQARLHPKTPAPAAATPVAVDDVPLEDDDDQTRRIPIISKVAPVEPIGELEQHTAGVPSELQEQPIVLAGNPTTPVDRITNDSTTGHAPFKPFINEFEDHMKPHLGDTVLNRYTLVSPLREEAGLQAWKANDRVLSRDVQLFIVNDSAILETTNAIAGTLAASHDPHFTPVIQIKHDGQVAAVITQLDAGQSISEYLTASANAPLGIEAMRSIIGQSSLAIRTLQKERLTHHAISTDTIRITTSGVQLADAPISQALADTSGAQPSDNPERRAVRQLAAVLYCMLTRTVSHMHPQFSLQNLPKDTPDEFYVIVKRGLELSEDGSATVPLVTLTELELLLGSYKPLHVLTRREIRHSSHDGACSIVRAMIQPALPGDILPIPDTMVSSQTMSSLQLSAAGAAAAAQAAEAAEDRALGLQTPEDKSLKAVWNRSKAIMEGEEDNANIPEINPQDATEMFSAFNPNTMLDSPSQPYRMTVPINVSQVRNGELDAEEPDSISSTGRIPVLDDEGHAIPDGSQSQRALEQEREDIDATYVMGTEALPPSFAPQDPHVAAPHPANYEEETAKKKTKTGRRAAIIVCVVLVLAALGTAIYNFAAHGSLFGSLKNDNSSYWPNMNLDDVPFGQRKGNEVETPERDAETPTPTPSKTETKKPENTTPYELANRQFLTSPNGVSGYGYYVTLTKQEDVSKVVIKIRSSGGQGYIKINTGGDPSKGEQVAQFAFDASGTTEVKLDKSVKTDNVMLWVPMDSLPGNQLYIDSFQVY